MCNAGSCLLVRGRELLICWASGSFFTRQKVLQGKHQRVSKSDSVIVRLPKFRCLFELFEVSLLPCNPNRSFPTLPLFSWPAFMSLPKPKLLPLTNIFFPSRPPLIQFLLNSWPKPSRFWQHSTRKDLALCQPVCVALLVSQFRVCFTLCIPGCITIPEKQQSTKLRTPDLTQTTCWVLGFFWELKGKVRCGCFGGLAVSPKASQICGVLEVSEF